MFNELTGLMDSGRSGAACPIEACPGGASPIQLPMEGPVRRAGIQLFTLSLCLSLTGHAFGSQKDPVPTGEVQSELPVSASPESEVPKAESELLIPDEDSVEIPGVDFPDQTGRNFDVIEPAAPDRAQKSADSWLLRHDSFTVQTQLTKRTYFSVAGGAETVTETTDRMTLQYQVEAVGSAGELAVRVRVQHLSRDDLTGERIPGDKIKAAEAGNVDAQRRLHALNDAQVMMILSSNGVVEQISSSDQEALIRALSGGRQVSGFLSECCTEDAVASWLARPFWLAEDHADAESGSNEQTRVLRDRIDQIGLGFLGRFRVNLRCEAGVDQAGVDQAGVDKEGADKDGDATAEAADSGREMELTDSKSAYREILISGNGTYLPPSPGHQMFADLPLSVRQSDVVLDRFEGSARIAMGVLETGGRRAPFDQLNIEYQFHGTCELDVAGRILPASFRQEQTHTWNLVNWRPGQDRLVPLPFREQRRR